MVSFSIVEIDVSSMATKHQKKIHAITKKSCNISKCCFFKQHRFGFNLYLVWTHELHRICLKQCFPPQNVSIFNACTQEKKIAGDLSKCSCCEQTFCRAHTCTIFIQELPCVLCDWTASINHFGTCFNVGVVYFKSNFYFSFIYIHQQPADLFAALEFDPKTSIYSTLDMGKTHAVWLSKPDYF